MPKVKNNINKEKILSEATNFFRKIIAPNHLRNLAKLIKLEEFNYNPFLLDYLATFLTGKDDAKSMAKVLIYPRILGTSISTSFGQNIQTFCSKVLPGYGSAVSGIDLEFIDQLDKRRKYCQIKAGPNTINKDDVETVTGHFKKIENLARTNKLRLEYGDLVVGILYGEPSEINANYKRLAKHYPLIVGKDFWHRLTGDKDFYFNLIDAFGEIAKKTEAKEMLEETIDKLSKEIQEEIINKG